LVGSHEKRSTVLAGCVNKSVFYTLATLETAVASRHHGC
jgi:hypothetical protein